MTITVYRDTTGDWRWTMKARNGRTIADSAEGYRRRAACIRMARLIADAHPEVHIAKDA